MRGLCGALRASAGLSARPGSSWCRCVGAAPSLPPALWHWPGPRSSDPHGCSSGRCPPGRGCSLKVQGTPGPPRLPKGLTLHGHPQPTGCCVWVPPVAPGPSGASAVPDVRLGREGAPVKAEGQAQQVGTVGIYLRLPTGQPGTPGAFQDGSSSERHGGAGTEPPGASGEHPEAEARLALRPGGVWGADGHSGRLDHALVGVEDVALEGQAEAHGLGGLRPLRLFRLGCLAPASTAPLLEGGRQDLLGLGAQATCEAQRGSPSLHLVPDSAVTPRMEPRPPSTGLARRPPMEPGPPPPITGRIHTSCAPAAPPTLVRHQPIWPGAQRGSHQFPAPCLCPRPWGSPVLAGCVLSCRERLAAPGAH